MKLFITSSAIALMLGMATAQAQDTQPVLGKSGGHGLAAFMASYDETGDGVVTRADYFAIRSARFTEADKDGDGKLSKEEYVAEFEARLAADYDAAGREPDDAYRENLVQAADRFELLDLNKDGFMDPGEFFAQAHVSFARVDTNRDGVVDDNDPPPQRRAAVTDADFSETTEFSGALRAQGPEGTPLYAGGQAEITGRGLTPGQRITLQRGAVALNGQPLVVDEGGNVTFYFALPGDAQPGLFPVFVIGEDPVASTSFDLKISPRLEVMGEDRFAVEQVQVAQGLYQSAYSSAEEALFVTGTAFSGGAPVSTLTKVAPDTLEVEASITVPESDAAGESPMARVAAVFGVAVDEANGTVWVTNTIQNTVAVYDQSDLALVKQFEPGVIRHSREVVIDAADGRAYVSGSASNEVAVFDTAALEYLETVRITSGQRGGDFTVMGLALDPEAGEVLAVSRTSNEVAAIDTADTSDIRVMTVEGIRNAAGIAFDADHGRLLIASQDSDDLTAVDPATGDVVFRTPVGAGALAVGYSDGLAYVANRGADTLTVVDAEGAVVANLAIGSYPNHVAFDSNGRAFVTNKARSADDATADHLTRLERLD